ncbi:hypothetical protein ABT086_26680 [Streptomyces mirabilis]
MSRPRRRRPRRGDRRPGRQTPSTTIVLAEGEGAGLPLTITGLSDEDVAEARRQVAAGNLGHDLVLRIVAAFIESVGVDINAHTWSGPEYVALLEMLGFAPFEWSACEDAELAELLAEGGCSRGE